MGLWDRIKNSCSELINRLTHTYFIRKLTFTTDEDEYDEEFYTPTSDEYLTPNDGYLTPSEEYLTPNEDEIEDDFEIDDEDDSNSEAYEPDYERDDGSESEGDFDEFMTDQDRENIDIHNPTRRRLNVRTYEDLINRLSTILFINPNLEHNYFTLRINYRLLGATNPDGSSIFRVQNDLERRFTNVRIRDMINHLKEDVQRLEERYNVHLVQKGNKLVMDVNGIDEENSEEYDLQHNLQYAILSVENGQFGKGNKNYNFVFHDNKKLYSVIFPSTRNKCLVKCVYEELGRKESDKFFKNTRFRDMSFEAQKIAIKSHLGIDVVISQSLETLKYDLSMKKENEIVLFARDKHVGRIIEGVPEYKETIRKYALPKYAESNKIIKVGYDCEFSYDSDGIPKKSNLVCAAFIYKKDNFDKSFQSFRNFIIFLEEYAVAKQTDVYCYAHNAQKVENVFVLQELVKMKDLKQTVVYNFSGNKIRSYNYTVSQKIYYEEDGVTKSRMQHYNLYFYDTLCYAKNSLDKIAKMFQLLTTKGHNDWPLMKNGDRGFINDEEKNLWYRNKKWSINNKNDVDYCLSDARIALELAFKMDSFIKEIFDEDLQLIYKRFNKQKREEYENDKSNKKPFMPVYYSPKNIWTMNKASMASVCRSIFHVLYKDILNTNEEASIFKTMYYGGRNECFFIGDTPIGKKVYTIDVNSHYPNEMREGFAGKFVHSVQKKQRLIDINYVLRNAARNKLRWCAYIRLRYKEKMRYPLLAVFKNGKLLFPNIMNTTLVPIWDVEYEAIKNNLIIESIEYVAFFKPCSFAKQIDKLAKIKTETKDPAMRAFSKIMMNSVYGIAGMDSYRPVKELVKRTPIPLEEEIIEEEEIVEDSSDEIENDEIDKFDNDNLNFNRCTSDFFISSGFDGYDWYMYRTFSNVNSSFQAASSITAQARLKLWQLIMFAVSKGYKPIYCDTDSVMMIQQKISNEPFEITFADFLHQTEIGKWDVEYHDNMKILTNKAYAYIDSDGTKIKCKGVNASAISSIKIENLIPNMSCDVSGVRVTKQLTIEPYVQTKTFSFEYKKGIVTKNGDVIPYEI